MNSTTNKILLPRGYLSYSALMMWKSSKEKYRERYYYGEEGFQGTKEMKYGSKFAEAMENGEDDDILISAVSSLIPRYKNIEFEIRVKFDNIELLGKLDAFDLKTKTFIEYKTGKHAWTKAKVDTNEQITTYFLLVYLKYKKIPKVATLYWIETEDVDGQIACTGRIECFKTMRNLTQILRMANKYKKVAQEISEDYQIELGTIPKAKTKQKKKLTF